MYSFIVILCVSFTFHLVSGKESRILWSVDEPDASRSCIYSITGDATLWVTSLKVDDQFEVTADPLCVDNRLIKVGHLAVNPAIPDVVVSSEMVDNDLLYFEATNDGDVQTFFTGSSDVTGVAFDYQSLNVYYTDPGTGLVIVQYAVSRPYFRVILEGLDQPHSVLVDPDQGFVFWAEATVMRRCTLTGGSPKTLLTGLSASTLLGLDSSSQTLFVLDQSVGTLRSMSYQGTGVTSLVNDPVNIDPGTFSGITIQQGYIFGTLTAEATIIIMDQTTGERLADLSFPITDATQHGITSTSTEPAVATGLCKQNNGGCSHMCVHQTDVTRVCLCSMGYELQNDGVSCESDFFLDDFLLVSDSGADRIYQMGLETAEVRGIPVERTINQRIEALLYEPEGRQVIWVDTGNGTLRSKVLERDSGERVIYTFPADSVVEGIAYNPRDRSIYYVDAAEKKLGRVSLDDGSQQYILRLSSNKSPLKIQVDGEQGYIYWTDVGSHATIERCRLNGGGKETLVRKDIETPSGLVINTDLKHVYWSDETLKRIDKMNMDGTDRQQLRTDEAVYAMTTDTKYIYVAKPHRVMRYGINDQSGSNLGPNWFSLLYEVYVYSSSIGRTTTPNPDITTTTATTGAGVPIGVLWHIVASWLVLWVCKL